MGFERGVKPELLNKRVVAFLASNGTSSLRDIYESLELRKILSETDKIAALKEILHSRKLRIPTKLEYGEIKAFRNDSAHRNLGKWLTALHNSVQEEEEPPVFDETLVNEIEELTSVVQGDIKKGSLAVTAGLSALAAYLSCLNPAALLALASSMVSYVPFTYAFSRLYRKIGKSNFIMYSVDWRKPPIRAK